MRGGGTHLPFLNSSVCRRRTTTRKKMGYLVLSLIHRHRDVCTLSSAIHSGA